MSNIIQGVKVNGVVYKYDYESLENLPDPELPTCDSNDEGKVLAVNDSGVPQWSTFPSGLPSSTASDSGKALVVNSTGNPAWRTLPSELPSSSASDARKALVVNSTGEPVWRDLIPSHNSDYDGSDAGKVLTVATNGSLTWEAGGSGGLSLPDTCNATDGDVLIVHPSAGTLEWGSPLPFYDNEYDVGKALMITENNGVCWNEVLPTYDTGEDIGKVLTVTANGPEWVNPSN